MHRKQERWLRQNVLPTLAAFIWGTGFVAQSLGASSLDPFAFTAARSVVAFLFLLLLCLGRRTLAGDTAPVTNWRNLLKGGLACGTVLTVASCLQQKGLETTASGKAGFLTALYVVLVPVLGMLAGKRTPLNVWCSLPLAAAGLYFLCGGGPMDLEPGDLYILLCAVCFAVHILIIDRFTALVDGMELSCVQFLTVAVLCFLSAVVFREPFSLAGLRLALGPILYLGIFSSGVAFTLQILAQKGSDPTVVSLLMSLESVFATLAGAAILHERLTGQEYLGCVLMLGAVVLSQLPPQRRGRAE